MVQDIDWGVVYILTAVIIAIIILIIFLEIRRRKEERELYEENIEKYKKALRTYSELPDHLKTRYSPKMRALYDFLLRKRSELQKKK
ncbi:MAG: hypothetical protein PHW96_03290 [Candidatus Nanoarchaeia archaeon]|nr:hypothetical protein [Candidatus Nanoarchaeia archaeon]